MPENSSHRRRRLLALLVLAIALLLAWRWWPAGEDVTIGVEGRRTVEIPGARLAAVPFTFADPLAVRIAKATPTAAGYRYDLRYMAYGPGEFDLGDYLVDENNQRPTKLAPLPVSVASILPADHAGELYDSQTSPIDLQTRYWLWTGLTWGAWAVLLLPLVAYGRTRHRPAPAPPPPPSVPERLRQLLEQAEADDLPPEQQADLEKLLMAYWAGRLGVTAERLEDTLAQLRQHPGAARQVERLERWLHSRTPTARPEVARELLDELACEGSTSDSWSPAGSPR